MLVTGLEMEAWGLDQATASFFVNCRDESRQEVESQEDAKSNLVPTRQFLFWVPTDTELAFFSDLCYFLPVNLILFSASICLAVFLSFITKQLLNKSVAELCLMTFQSCLALLKETSNGPKEYWGMILSSNGPINKTL